MNRDMHNDRVWMRLQLASVGLNEYERNKAMTMIARGHTIGSLLARVWKALRGA